MQFIQVIPAKISRSASSSWFFRLVPVLYCLHITSPAARAQNLVPNPSFEINAAFDNVNFNNGCAWTSNVSGFGMSKLESRISNWYQGGMSPDVFSICDCPPESYGAGFVCNGYNPLANQTPRTGRHCAWLRFYSLADYVGVRLTKPLVAGVTYPVSFWASRAENSDPSDGLGIYFTNEKYEVPCCGLPASPPVPQFKNTPGNYITDADGWTQISGSYTATGGEEYMMIGYWSPIDVHTVGGTSADVFIDDVVVEDNIPTPLNLINFEAERTGAYEVLLSWRTSMEDNTCTFEPERSVDGIHFEPVSAMKAAGNSTKLTEYQLTDTQPPVHGGYYRLKSIDCDGSVYYSRIVSVSSKLFSHAVTVYPNPARSEFSVKIDAPGDFTVDVELTGMAGNKILGQSLFYHSQTLLIIDLSAVPAGMYVLSVTGENLQPFYTKLVKE